MHTYGALIGTMIESSRSRNRDDNKFSPITLFSFYKIPVYEKLGLQRAKDRSMRN